MTDFFFQVIKDAVNYSEKEQMAELYALTLQDMRDWCEDMLNLAGVPRGAFRSAYLSELFDSDDPDRLWRYIQDVCAPDPEEATDDKEGADEDTDAEEDADAEEGNGEDAEQ